MRINNNIPALNTHRILNMNTNAIEKSLERLSSGKRINRAAMMPQEWLLLKKCRLKSGG